MTLLHRLYSLLYFVRLPHFILSIIMYAILPYSVFGLGAFAKL